MQVPELISASLAPFKCLALPLITRSTLGDITLFLAISALSFFVYVTHLARIRATAAQASSNHRDAPDSSAINQESLALAQAPLAQVQPQSSICKGDAVKESPEALQVYDDWNASMAKDTPWNESEFVRLWSEMLRLIVLLGPIASQEIDWAPEDGHASETFDIARLQGQYGRSDAVVSLLRRMPCTRAEVLTFSRSIDYRNAFDLWMVFENGAYGNLPASVLQLSRGDAAGQHVFLDVQKNKIYIADGSKSIAESYPRGAEMTPPPEPEEGRYLYDHFIARDAIAWLRHRIFELQSLRVIPDRGHFYDSSGTMSWMVNRVRQILVGKYGWPDQFDAEGWERDASDVWNETIDLHESLGSPMHGYTALCDGRP